MIRQGATLAALLSEKDLAIRESGTGLAATSRRPTSARGLSDVLIAHRLAGRGRVGSVRAELASPQHRSGCSPPGSACP